MYVDVKTAKLAVELVGRAFASQHIKHTLIIAILAHKVNNYRTFLAGF